MATSLSFRSSFVIFFLIAPMFTFLIEVSNAGPEGSLRPAWCPNACVDRCGTTSLPKKKCVSTCTVCCEWCLCVPSGTSGNRDECRCYGHWKKPDGQLKCP